MMMALIDCFAVPTSSTSTLCFAASKLNGNVVQIRLSPCLMTVQKVRDTKSVDVVDSWTDSKQKISFTGSVKTASMKTDSVEAAVNEAPAQTMQEAPITAPAEAPTEANVEIPHIAEPVVEVKAEEKIMNNFQPLVPEAVVPHAVELPEEASAKELTKETDVQKQAVEQLVAKFVQQSTVEESMFQIAEQEEVDVKEPAAELIKEEEAVVEKLAAELVKQEEAAIGEPVAELVKEKNMAVVEPIAELAKEEEAFIEGPTANLVKKEESAVDDSVAELVKHEEAAVGQPVAELVRKVVAVVEEPEDDLVKVAAVVEEPQGKVVNEAAKEEVVPELAKDLEAQLPRMELEEAAPAKETAAAVENVAADAKSKEITAPKSNIVPAPADIKEVLRKATEAADAANAVAAKGKALAAAGAAHAEEKRLAISAKSSASETPTPAEEKKSDADYDFFSTLTSFFGAVYKAHVLWPWSQGLSWLRFKAVARWVRFRGANKHAQRQSHQRSMDETRRQFKNVGPATLEEAACQGLVTIIDMIWTTKGVCRLPDTKSYSKSCIMSACAQDLCHVAKVTPCGGAKSASSASSMSK
eukprot:365270-Chlamydomonas_euryale.AAC.8